MGINRVQQAVEEYERVAKKAAQVYEDALQVYKDALRKAEADLKFAMSSNEPEPPVQNTVTMNKDDFDNLQNQLKVVSEFIKNNPNLNVNG